jgi:hypothetical protein
VLLLRDRQGGELLVVVLHLQGGTVSHQSAVRQADAQSGADFGPFNSERVVVMLFSATRYCCTLLSQPRLSPRIRLYLQTYRQMRPLRIIDTSEVVTPYLTAISRCKPISERIARTSSDDSFRRPFLSP